jgi:hypothetical protein
MRHSKEYKNFGKQLVYQKFVRQAASAIGYTRDSAIAKHPVSEAHSRISRLRLYLCLNLSSRLTVGLSVPTYTLAGM